jgi:hypothetical protein
MAKRARLEKRKNKSAAEERSDFDKQQRSSKRARLYK